MFNFRFSLSATLSIFFEWYRFCSSFLSSNAIMDSVIVICITNNLPLGSPQWHMVCGPSLGTCNVHCHVRWPIHIYGCNSTFRTRRPYRTEHRGQGNTITITNSSEIIIRESKKKFTNLLLSGTFQQVHPADLRIRRVIDDGRQSQIYTKATSKVQSEQRTETNQTRITTDIKQ